MVRVRSTQKFPSDSDLPPCESPGQCGENRDPGGRRHEVLNGQRHHLDEVAQRRFAAVILPVRVGGETDSDIEGGVRSDGRKSLGIPGQQVLGSQQRIHTEKTHQVKGEKRGRVHIPGHGGFGIDAAGAIDAALQRPQYAAEHGLAALQQIRDVGSERFDQKQNHSQERAYLD